MIVKIRVLPAVQKFMTSEVVAPKFKANKIENKQLHKHLICSYLKCNY